MQYCASIFHPTQVSLLEIRSKLKLAKQVSSCTIRRVLFREIRELLYCPQSYADSSHVRGPSLIPERLEHSC